jgi:hypothetical protein
MGVVSGVTAEPENGGWGHSGAIVSTDVGGDGQAAAWSCAEEVRTGADADAVAGGDFTEARGILGAALPVDIIELLAG